MPLTGPPSTMPMSSWTLTLGGASAEVTMRKPPALMLVDDLTQVLH